MGSITTPDEMLIAAEAQLEQAQVIQDDARQALQLANEVVNRWTRVINALRPPVPKAKDESERKPGTSHGRPRISEQRLDEMSDTLLAAFGLDKTFLTKDAREVLKISGSRASQVMSELRERGDVRLAGRAPGRGVIPVWAMTPQAELNRSLREQEDASNNGVSEPTHEQEREHEWQA